MTKVLQKRYSSKNATKTLHFLLQNLQFFDEKMADFGVFLAKNRDIYDFVAKIAKIPPISITL